MSHSFATPCTVHGIFQARILRRVAISFSRDLPDPGIKPAGIALKNSPANVGYARDMGSIPGSGRFPGEGNPNPVQYSWLENSMDSRA